jgi:protoporphyrinogen oxidase
MGTGRSAETDCVIVGGGLAGLRAAVELAREGRSVRVVEAEDAVGGRARTVWHDGLPVDRGFQSVFTGYPQTRAFIREIGIPDRDLRAFARGLVYVDGTEIRRVGWLGGLKPHRGGIGVEDIVAAGRLLASCRARSPESWLATEGTTTEQFLREEGFSGGFIDKIVRPLFGPIMQDRSLAADSGYFRYLLSVMARGQAVIPSDGVGMIAEWAAAAVRVSGGIIELGTHAQALETGPDGAVESVRLSDGRSVSGRAVVLAAVGPATAALLEEVDPAATARLTREWASSVSLAFALDLPLYRGRTLLLNAAPDIGAPRVDLLCQTSNISRPAQAKAGGPHIVLASLIATGGAEVGGAEAAEAVAEFVAGAAPRFDWKRHATPIGTWRHPHALPRPLPGDRFTWPETLTAAPNLVVAGDALEHPSVEGAITSGAEAARAVAEILAGAA